MRRALGLGSLIACCLALAGLSALAAAGPKSLLDGLGPAGAPKGNVLVSARVELGAADETELVVRLEPRGAARLVAEPGVTVTPVARDGINWAVPVLLHEEAGRGYFDPPVEVRLPFAAPGGGRVEALVDYAYCLKDFQCLFGEATVRAEAPAG